MTEVKIKYNTAFNGDIWESEPVTITIDGKEYQAYENNLRTAIIACLDHFGVKDYKIEQNFE